MKTIKSEDDRSNLELKYSKYLAKLYFLYKIDEHELRNENNGLFEDCFELDDDEEEAAERETEEQADTDSGAEEQPPPKLQDMSDDKEFLHKLVQCVREYPAIWNTKHDDYNDIMVRDNYWQEISQKLSEYKRKYLKANRKQKNCIEGNVTLFFHCISGDVKSIKLRWQLAKFSYYRFKREKGQIMENTKMEQYCKNLPVDDMSFLD